MRLLISRENEDETSLQYAMDFLEETKIANDEILESKALLNLAKAHLNLFNVQNCLHFRDECLQLARRIRHAKIEMESKYEKAVAYLVLGENSKAYYMLKDCLAFLRSDSNDKYLESTLLNNISYAALRLSQKYQGKESEGFNSKLRTETLEFIERSLRISQSIDNPYSVALAHLNKGLLFMESYKDYEKALEHFNEELRIGKKLKSARLIHNGYCKYYMKALKTEDPPCTHWCEAENLRFNLDHLLALMYIGEKRWKVAAKYL